MSKISDEAVQAKTGRTWRDWFELLDRAGATRMSHKEIVAHLTEKEQVGAWWRQSIAVAYEQDRGLRALHEKADGFEVGASKTIAAPVSRVYAAFATDRERALWLEEDRLIITTARSEKTVRGTWADGPSRLDVYFTPRSADKTQVSVQHGKLDTAEAADEMKDFWKSNLEILKKHLEGPSSR